VSLTDIQHIISTESAITPLLQHNEHFAATFTALHRSETYSGILDTAKRIYFTVATSSSSAPLYFTGAIRADGNLVRTFCQIDKGGQCTSNGEYGLWSVAPGTP